MRRCVIVGGAEIQDGAFIRSLLRSDDFFIFCDGGLRHRALLGVEPELIVGDFDSFARPELDVETIVLPRVKDDTDTVFAAREALRRGFEEFLLLGAAGGRLDHTLGNVAILLMLHRQGRRALLADDFSLMEIVGDSPAEILESFSFFSLLCVDGPVRGVDVEGAKFPLRGAEITADYPYGVSNEVLPGHTARVRVREGVLLLIRVR